MNTADFIENFPSFENRTNRLIELVNIEISKLPTRISSMNNMDPKYFNTIYNKLDGYSLEVERKIETIKKWNKPVITCCASGMRSSSAASILKKNGLEAYNAGPWQKADKLA